jgi:hypothetical protein
MAPSQDSTEDVGEREEYLRIRALQSSPSRTVFTEDDNSDGWISTDLTVEIER